MCKWWGQGRESLAGVISVDIESHDQKWSRHRDGDRNSKTEHSLVSCLWIWRTENRPVVADAREARNLILPTFSSFGLSGMPTWDTNTKAFCSHDVSVWSLLCLNSCHCHYSLWRRFHLKTTWPWSRKTVIAAHFHVRLFLPFPLEPLLPLPPLSFFSVKQLANFLCLTSAVFTIWLLYIVQFHCNYIHSF